MVIDCRDGIIGLTGQLDCWLIEWGGSVRSRGSTRRDCAVLCFSEFKLTSLSYLYFWFLSLMGAYCSRYSLLSSLPSRLAEKTITFLIAMWDGVGAVRSQLCNRLIATENLCRNTVPRFLFSSLIFLHAHRLFSYLLFDRRSAIINQESSAACSAACFHSVLFFVRVFRLRDFQLCSFLFT